VKITQRQVREIFEIYLPDVVTIEFLGRDKFVRESLLNPFIREQIRVGIYDEENIYTDLLSVAKAYSLLRKVEVCMDLIRDHVEFLDEELALAFIHWTAAHEAHHFEDAHMLPSGDPRVQALHEKECNDLVAERYPHLEALMTEAELTSPVYQRVYKRIEAISDARREARQE
jgi:hypothetical protein